MLCSFLWGSKNWMNSASMNEELAAEIQGLRIKLVVKTTKNMKNWLVVPKKGKFKL